MASPRALAAFGQRAKRSSGDKEVPTSRPSSARPLTLAQQFLALQAAALTRSGTGRLDRERLEWEFSLRPSPLGREYRLRLIYHRDQPPSVVVVDPHLVQLANGRRLPHVYQQSPPRLCLFLPGNREWLPTMTLTTTFVPWAMQWLYFFEDWLATDDWQGGGVHPEEANDKPIPKAHPRNRWWRR